MPSAPDPNYWGNPPQTPRSSNIPQQPAHHESPEPPMGAQSAMPMQNGAAPQQAPFVPTNGNGTTQTGTNFQQAPQGSFIPPAPAAPPAPIRPEKKKTGIIVAIAIIAALLVGMGGCAACAAVLSTTLDDADDDWHAHNDFGQEYQNYSAPISEQEFLNGETRTDFGLVGSTALNGAELDAVQSSYFGNASKAPDANGKYAAGVYRVGTAIGLPAINPASPPSISFSQLLRELPPTTPCTSIAITATISWTCAKAKCSSSTTRAPCSLSIK